VIAFARVRELIGHEELLDLAPGARVHDVWSALTARAPALRELSATTRAAINGRLAAFDEGLSDGDELAFLPPVGGG